MNLFSNKKSSNKKGFTLVEVLVGATIISLTTFSLVSAGAKGVELSLRAMRQTQASYLLEEGAEAVKSIRDSAWSNISGLTVGTTYYLSYNTSTNVWSLSTTPSTIDSIFTRTIVVSAVNRDSNDDISSSGTTDAYTKKVDVTVSWTSASGTVSKTLSLYISDIFS